MTPGHWTCRSPAVFDTTSMQISMPTTEKTRGMGMATTVTESSDENHPSLAQPARIAWSVDVVVAIALSGVVLLASRRALAPDGLWRDDAWPALSTRVDSYATAFRMGGTAPGWTALLRAWSKVAGNSPLALQLPPLLAGMALPPLVVLLARRLGLGRMGAFVAGGVVATSPVVILYSTRVKQYTLDGVSSCVALLLVLWLLEAPREGRRWWITVAAAELSLVISASPAIVWVSGLLWGGIALVSHGKGRSAAVGLSLYLVSAGGMFLLVSHWVGRAVLHQFWVQAEAFLTPDLHSVGTVAARLGGGLVAAPSRFAHPAALLAIAVCAVGSLALTAQWCREARTGVRTWLSPPHALALTATPMLAALALAALSVVPLGTGRTDLYLYPGLALLIGATVDLMARAGRERLGSVALPFVSVGVVLLCTFVVIRPVQYPAFPVAAEEGRILVGLGPQDHIVVLQATTYCWALAAPSDAGVGIRDDPASATGWTPTLADPRITSISDGVYLGPASEVGRAALRSGLQQLDSALGTGRRLAKVTLVGTASPPLLTPAEFAQRLAADGLTKTSSRTVGDVVTDVWTRVP